MPAMVLRSSRGKPLNAPAVFIHPCRPVVAKSAGLLNFIVAIYLIVTGLIGLNSIYHFLR
jgi:Protein of unknown function (DUF3096)